MKPTVEQLQALLRLTDGKVTYTGALGLAAVGLWLLYNCDCEKGLEALCAALAVAGLRRAVSSPSRDGTPAGNSEKIQTPGGTS